MPRGIRWCANGEKQRDENERVARGLDLRGDLKCSCSRRRVPGLPFAAFDSSGPCARVTLRSLPCAGSPLGNIQTASDYPPETGEAGPLDLHSEKEKKKAQGQFPWDGKQRLITTVVTKMNRQTVYRKRFQPQPGD